MLVYHIRAMPSAYRSQKSVQDILEAELQMAVSHHEGAGNQTQVLCKNKQCSRANFLVQEYIDSHI